jgi:CRP-like cAMP-binding protein
MLTDAERRALLARVGAAALELPRAEWAAFEALLSARRLRKGELFIKPGDASGRFGLVRSGLLRFYYVGADGSDATKAFRGPGEFAAAYAEMLMGAPSRTHIEALEDSELLVADYARIKGLYRRHAGWQELGRLIAENFYINKERREFELLQLSARERYALFDQEYPGLAKRIPQYHVASYLGITPVALSRIVSGLKRRGS